MSLSADRDDTPGTWRPMPSSPLALRDRLTSAISRVGLPHLLLLALALRLAVAAIATPAHPDEVFQYLETAHRVLFKHGVVTWEWRAGIRGWLLPLLVAVPMGLGSWLDPHGALYLTLPKLVMVGLSLVTVAAAWKLGERVSRVHAQVAGFVAAIWYEFIYFAPHVMSETAAIALILPAALLLIDRQRWTAWRLALAAALLANAAALRFQYLPAIGVLVMACCIADLRKSWWPLLLGGLAGLAPSVVCDLAMGSTPFAWILENFRLNIVENRAAAFSSSGPFGYAGEVWPRLALWAVPLVVLAAFGARRYPALAWMALANLVFHSAVTHKEYRFILLSVLVAVLLAAIGTVDWAAAVARKDGTEAGRAKLRFLCIVWVIASVSCGAGGFRSQWVKFQPEMDLYTRLRGDPALCGLAVYRHDFPTTGGYTYLHRATPMLYFTGEDPVHPWAGLAQSAGGFNTIMTPAVYAAELPGQFKTLACEGRGAKRVCLYRRPGACTAADPHFAINTVLQRIDQ
jgi:GPI mannosyltransferase 3